jgi:predicted nucleotidyltransferase
MRDNPVIARSRDNRRAFAAGSEDRSGQGRGKPSGSADPEQILAASRSRQRSRLFKRVRANLVPICWQRCARMRRSCGLGALVQFGSVARGDATSASDVDLAVRPGVGFSAGGFDHFSRLDALRDRLSALLGCDVDLVEETAARVRLRQMIERDGVRAF